MASLPKLITLEEHFMSVQHVPHCTTTYTTFGGDVQRKLADLDAERLAEMDAGEITQQVISHAPIVANAEQCRRANDELAAACAKHVPRLKGFAMLAMREPESATAELERAVKELGFLGALINNHEEGTYYDDPRFWGVFRKAAELDVPIYIHPAFPSPAMAELHKGNYPDIVAQFLSTASWSWHSDTGLHVLRLFAAGLFDEIPTLKLVIGHDGEMLPFMLDRTEKHTPRWGARSRGLKQVWKENVWVTTSAMFSLAPFACLLRVTDVGKIMYSVDYPFVSNSAGLAFLKELQDSDLVNEEEFAQICHGNAEKLLKLK